LPTARTVYALVAAQLHTAATSAALDTRAIDTPWTLMYWDQSLKVILSTWIPGGNPGGGGARWTTGSGGGVDDPINSSPRAYNQSRAFAASSTGKVKVTKFVSFVGSTGIDGGNSGGSVDPINSAPRAINQSRAFAASSTVKVKVTKFDSFVGSAGVFDSAIVPPEVCLPRAPARNAGAMPDRDEIATFLAPPSSPAAPTGPRIQVLGFGFAALPS
jgi:hypothetical protein